MAGVASVGDMKNWCGSDMPQVNWYAFGRMAWNDAITPRQIADEWLKQTYATDRAFVEPMTDLLMENREAVVRYMMPLGLAEFPECSLRERLNQRFKVWVFMLQGRMAGRCRGNFRPRSVWMVLPRQRKNKCGIMAA